MKRKRLTAVLLVLVLVVWGAVFWRVFWERSRAQQEPEAGPGPTALAPPVAPPEPKDTLLLNYRDPFLGTPLAQQPGRTLAGEPDKARKTAHSAVDPPTPWPEIRYQGMVRAVKNGKATALIRIAGKEHLVGLGERPNDLRVVLFTTDSLVLEREPNERKTFKVR